MKRKALSFLLVLSCIASLAACSSKADSSQDETESSSTQTSVENTSEAGTPESSTVPESTESTEASEPSQASGSNVELSDNLYDCQVAIDGVVYQIPMWYSDLENLGWEYTADATKTLSSNQYIAAEQWKKGDKTSILTKIANLSANTAAYSDCSIVKITLEDFYLRNCGWDIILPQNIQYNVSGRDDVIAAYGAPTTEYESELYYKMTYKQGSNQEINLFVFKESGTLDKIEIENIAVLEGRDNSVDSAVPDVVKNYSAPDSVGNDLYQFNMELEGKLYTLPCPVSELLANGFTIKKDSSASAVAAQNFNWVELQYNSKSYRVIVNNYADYATIPENCFITSMKSNNYDFDLALTIPGNIKRGDSEDSVVAAIKNFNYDKESEKTTTVYTIYNPDGKKTDQFVITVKDGVVSAIEARTSAKPN